MQIDLKFRIKFLIVEAYARSKLKRVTLVSSFGNIHIMEVIFG